MIKINVEGYCLNSPNAQQFDPRPCPPRTLFGKIGKCFDTSLLNALKNTDLFYVEGVAFSIIDKCWVHHAWLTDKKGKVCYDPTWHLQDKITKERKVYNSAYFGVKMDTDFMIEFVRSTGYNSVFAHGWRNKRLLQELIKDYNQYVI